MLSQAIEDQRGSSLYIKWFTNIKYIMSWILCNWQHTYEWINRGWCAKLKGEDPSGTNNNSNLNCHKSRSLWLLKYTMRVSGDSIKITF